MERAEAGESASLAGQLDALSDNVGQRHPLSQILNEFWWYGHSVPKGMSLSCRRGPGTGKPIYCGGQRPPASRVWIRPWREAPP